MGNEEILSRSECQEILLKAFASLWDDFQKSTDVSSKVDIASCLIDIFDISKLSGTFNRQRGGNHKT